MSEPEFPKIAIARVRLRIGAPVEEVTGWRKDGTPIIRRSYPVVQPGEQFLITDAAQLQRLIPEGDPLEVYADLVQNDKTPAPVTIEPERIRGRRHVNPGAPRADDDARDPPSEPESKRRSGRLYFEPF